MTVTVTKPDGDIETLGPFTAYATGGTYTTYVPDQVGTYKFVGNFPTQTIVNENPYPGIPPFGLEYVNDTVAASTSDVAELTVQQDPIETAYPPNPLPTEYWTRPINLMNKEWYPISGNWILTEADGWCGMTGANFATRNFNPYITAPNAPHVLWTKPIAFGGVIGGKFGGSDTDMYHTGTPYESKFHPIIINGVMYYTQYPTAKNNFGPLTAVDIRTGETLWTVETAYNNQLYTAMVYNYRSPNQYGALAYLFTAADLWNGFVLGPTYNNKFSMYDAATGMWILDIDNASLALGTPQFLEGPSGELISYTYNEGMLTKWNISKCIEAGAKKYNIFVSYGTEEIWRPPQGVTIDWNDGYEWSVPIATDISGEHINWLINQVTEEAIVMSTLGVSPSMAMLSLGTRVGYRFDVGYSPDDGHLLWGPNKSTRTLDTFEEFGPAADGVYTVHNIQEMAWYGYDIATGAKLWGPIHPYTNDWGYYSYCAHAVIGYGNLYLWSLGGDVACYDVQTGEFKWKWNAGSAGMESPYGVWPFGSYGGNHILADGKLYVAAGNDYAPPIFKGAKLYCLNATTGELIWDTLEFCVWQNPAVADGIMVWYNAYDNQVYAYGKGPSATTVTAPDTVQPLGTQILIKGTITDQSPGTKEYAQTARFPNGVPAISDENMSAWMEYLYQQQPLPQDAKGVEVVVEVLDPNNNYYEVGRTTSDANGMYKLMFTPEVPGEYSIIASFAGSESYWPSHAETAIGVEEAPAATPAPTPTPASIADMYFVPAVIGIIVAIAVVGAVMVLMLRKHS
jgi:outer membrane protein assembly factor BamB